METLLLFAISATYMCITYAVISGRRRRKKSNNEHTTTIYAMESYNIIINLYRDWNWGIKARRCESAACVCLPWDYLELPPHPLYVSVFLFALFLDVAMSKYVFHTFFGVFYSQTYLKLWIFKFFFNRHFKIKTVGSFWYFRLNFLSQGSLKIVFMNFIL